MDQLTLYRLLGDEVPVYVCKHIDGTIKVLSNWDIYLAALAK